jgi:sulfate-transporting ATPase
MAAFVQYLILGLGLGAAYALVAQGMVVIHRGSGVVNFANSGFGFLGAYVAFEVHQGGVPIAGAAAVGILAAAALGWIAHHAVMRRLWSAAQLTRVIATLGMLNLIVGLAVLKIGQGQPIPPYPLPDHRVSVLGRAVSTYDFWMLGIAVVLTAGLQLLYRRTSFGILTTATAENRRAASALGHSPDTIAGINWAIGSALAAAAGILIAPILSLSVVAIGLMLVPALAAAVMGDFTSFGITLLGALIVGVLESMVQWANIGQSWPDAVPFFAVIVILLFKGTALPGRSVMQARLPKVGSGTINWRIVIPAIAGVSILTAFVSSAFIAAMFLSAAFAIILLSSVVVTGYAGQLSLAQLGLAGIGAFIGARVAAAAGLGFWPALLIAMVGVLPIGLIAGIPALRTRGVNLAIVTLGIGVIVDEVVLANPSYTGGYTGTQVQPPSLFGFDLNAEFHPARYFLLCLAMLVICVLVVSNLRRSSVGRYLIAVRGNERAAASLGLNVARLKLYAFALSAVIAAIGGILIAFQAPFVNWSTGWDVESGLTLLTGLVLIGLGYTGGAVLGALAAAGGVIPYLFSQLGTTAVNTITPALAIGMLVGITKAPDGVLPTALAERARRRHRAAAAPSSGEAEADPAKQLALARADTARVEIQPRHGHELELERLSVNFGGVQALQDVSFSVSSGEIVGLIGPNGAGKTTLIDVVTGMTSPTGGSVRLDGSELGRTSAAARARRGLARSFQALELFEDLTVQENILVSADANRWWHYVQALAVSRKEELPPQARAAVDAFGLEQDLGRRPGELNYGRRRLVGIARAIAGGANIVLLDEPAAGLDERESAELAGLLRMLVDTWGIGILLVEHDMQLVMGVSDRIVALDFGQVICCGDPAAVRSDPRVMAAYLGEETHDPSPPPGLAPPAATAAAQVGR